MTNKPEQQITTGVSVFRQRLRNREQRHTQPYAFPKSCSLQTTNAPTPCASRTPKVKEAEPMQQVDWLRQNILVGIYDNWTRLEPFVKYWLQKQWPAMENTQVKVPFTYLRKHKNQTPLQASHREALSKRYLIFKRLRDQKEKLLRSLQLGVCVQDLNEEQTIEMVNKLANLMLDCLPAEQAIWTNQRIEKYNVLLENLLKTNNHAFFERNRDIILQCIKERIRFMAQVQKKYQKVSRKDKNIRQKIQLLKEPLKKYMKKTPLPEQTEKVFREIWEKVEERQNMLSEASRQARLQYGEQKQDKLTSDGNGKWSMSYMRQGRQSKSGPVFKRRDPKSKTKKLMPTSQTMHSSTNQEQIHSSKARVIFEDAQMDSQDDQTPADLKLDQTGRRVRSRKHLFNHRQEQQIDYLSKTEPKCVEKPNKVEQKPNVSMEKTMRASVKKSSKRLMRASRRESEEEMIQKFSRFKKGRGMQKRMDRKSSMMMFRSHESSQLGLKTVQPPERSFQWLAKSLQQDRHPRKPAHFRPHSRHNCETECIAVEQDDQLPEFIEGTPIEQRNKLINYFSNLIDSGALDKDKFQELKNKIQSLLKYCSPKNQMLNHQVAMKAVEKTLNNSASLSCSSLRRYKLLNQLRTQQESHGQQCQESVNESRALIEAGCMRKAEEEPFGMETIWLHSTSVRKVMNQLRGVLNGQQTPVQRSKIGHLEQKSLF